MRRSIGPAILAAALGAGCGTATPPSLPDTTSGAIAVVNLPSPFQRLDVGAVRAVVPDGWRARVAGGAGDPRSGLLARPDGGRDAEGMAALWVDLGAVGVASDLYYLAATRSLESLLPRRAECVAARTRVLVDRAPDFEAGGSPGDFIADGHGRCSLGETVLRWGYFVVAPGFGPERGVGIPTSGLYVVVAVVRDAPSARSAVRRILGGAAFGGAGIADFVAAAAA